jgi:hypothetical protein
MKYFFYSPRQTRLDVISFVNPGHREIRVAWIHTPGMLEEKRKGSGEYAKYIYVFRSPMIPYILETLTQITLYK